MKNEKVINRTRFHNCNLKRYLLMQEERYDYVLEKLKEGNKDDCRLFFIFPCLRSLARSRKAYVFGIVDVNEAKTYLAHPVLCARLNECCEAILEHRNKTAEEILGSAGAERLRASMTLFSLISEENSVFHLVLQQFFDNKKDLLTEGIVNGKIIDMTYRKYDMMYLR